MHRLLFICLITGFADVSKCEMESFIVGGQNAKRADFPYAAFLAMECRNEKGFLKSSWICGSSIVNQYITLTAGHCLHSCSKQTTISVSVGSVHILKGAISSAHSFVIHENYDDEYLENDIGLVRLRTPLKFNVNVRRVALMENPPYQEEALVSGWGLVNEQKRCATNELQFTKQYIWEHKDCKKLLRFVAAGTFCAQSKNASSFASEGDSGSALVVKNYIQVGLVSCKVSEISSSVVIYTDVGYFYKWIKKNARRLMCECNN